MYCVMVWQRVICMVRVLCGCVAACHSYVVRTVWWCGSVSYECCMHCVAVGQRFICMESVLCARVAACHSSGFCIV